MDKKRSKKKEKKEDVAHPDGCRCLRCFQERCRLSFKYVYQMTDKHIQNLTYLKKENDERKLEIAELRKEIKENSGCKCKTTKKKAAK